MQEEASIGQLRIHQQEELKCVSLIGRRNYGIVDHVGPEVGHGFMEGGPSGAVRSLSARTALDEAFDRLEDPFHSLAAAVVSQEQPSDPQVRVVVPDGQGGVLQLLQEEAVLIIHSFQPF